MRYSIAQMILTKNDEEPENLGEVCAEVELNC
jgi:hypothetical protein